MDAFIITKTSNPTKNRVHFVWHHMSEYFMCKGFHLYFGDMMLIQIQLKFIELDFLFKEEYVSNKKEKTSKIRYEGNANDSKLCKL